MRIYVAGPLGGNGLENHHKAIYNAQRALYAGAWLVSQGHFPVVPHVSMHMINILLKSNTTKIIPSADFWYCNDLYLLQACEAILLLDGWQNSKGCNIELDAAVLMNMPIFLESDIHELQDFLYPRFN